MWEIVYIAASYRCPIVMSLVNRALSGPINIHCDHSDVMGMRDSGWIILFSENCQEAYDNVIQAVRIAEHPDVLLPVVVCQDGFITSHAMERVEVYDDADVKAFVGTYRPKWSVLDVDNPKTYGALHFYDYYYESKRQQVEAMANAKPVILEVADEFNRKFNRNYGLFETYRLDDADVAIVVANSTAGTAKEVVDSLRTQGLKVGLLKPPRLPALPGEGTGRRPAPPEGLGGDGPLHRLRLYEQRRSPLPGTDGGAGHPRCPDPHRRLRLRPGWPRYQARRDRVRLSGPAPHRRDRKSGAVGDLPERSGVGKPMPVGPVLSPDTTPEAARVQMELLRRATVAQRFRPTRSLSQMAMELARRALRRRMPEASETEVNLAFVALWYGQDLAEELRRYLAQRQQAIREVSEGDEKWLLN